jgi:uncharacterized protein
MRLPPRALRDCAPSAPSGASARPLNFTVRYRFPGWPERLASRAAYMTAMEGYGMHLHSADGLVVHLSRDPRVVVLEYEVHGTAPSTRRPYDNRFCSIVTIERS